MPVPGPGDDDFVAGFLDDYFAESEEHLAAVRDALLALEDTIDAAGPAAPPLEELFRSFHSLKGISAMVDVREAESLAHELESCLRALRDGEVPLTRDVLTVLADATTLLERVIAARRARVPVPFIEGMTGRLAATTAGGRAARPQPSGERPAATPGEALWRFTFLPSPGLVERGIRVDTVRARLAGVGRITSASPKVIDGGGIAFEFLVATTADASPFEPWRNDGLTWARVDARESTGSDARETTSLARPAEPQPPDASLLVPSHFVRVDLRRLDEVMRRVADLVVTRARLDESLARVERSIPAPAWRALQENTLALERQLRDLREDVMRVRLVRVDEIFRRMPFVARDLARESRKDVRVALHGQNTELDKFLVERMMDPVLHLVRNAVSHGIERPDVRVAAGKPPQGLVTLTASTSGETIVLEIADDGAGIDLATVAERAGLAAGGGASLDDRALVDVICEPGFSTRPEADRASGRGIGMTVVKTTVQELGGTLSVSTEPGRGTRFTIGLPLTLAITDALIAVAGTHTFAIPQSSVREVIEVETGNVRRVEDRELIPYREGSLPLLRLSALFRFRSARPQRFHAFVMGSGQDALALGVDRILGQREIVVRTMTDALLRIDGISGATELGDGRVVLILDPAALRRQALTRRGRARSPNAPPNSGGLGEPALPRNASGGLS